MGEIADMMLDGTLCSECGAYVGRAYGPTLCKDCLKERRINYKKREQKESNIKGELK
jgi:hypothetical protein